MKDYEDDGEDKKLKDIHEQSKAEFEEIYSAVKGEREQALEDRRFYSISGAQWEGALRDQFDNKPRFEINKVHLSIIRIINEYRNNRITVNFVSKDGAANDDLADLCDGIYRAAEDDSEAEEAYDNAFEEAVGGGFGAWRYRAEYEDEGDPDNDKQKICIEPIYDADSSVFFDLQAKRQDKADAKSCYVITSMTRNAYKETYGDDVSSWGKGINSTEFDWYTPDVVYVAEKFCVEITEEKIHFFETINGDEERYSESELTDELMEKLIATGSKETKTKTVKKRRVRKYILSGSKILKDCGHIAGENIPVVPTYGKRWFIANVERFMGHVRLSKDPTRLKNMQISKLAEISALSPVEKPIFTPEQVAGHQVRWEQDNVKNYPYLLVNPITDLNGNDMPAGPIGYTRPPQIPPAMAALLQLTDQDLQDILGNQQNGEQIEGNISTDTAMLIQNRLDMQTYIYMSNMAKAIKRGGEIFLSMPKDVYVEEGRRLKTVGPQQEIGNVELMRQTVMESGDIAYENDLSKAKFDVAVEVGPSSSTKRSATVRTLSNVAAILEDPADKKIIAATIMMNLEGEGIGEIREYFRQQLVRSGVVKPNEEEAQQLAMEMQNQQPDPNAEYLKAAADRERMQAIESQADVELKLAKADETRMNTIETASKVTSEQIERAQQVMSQEAEESQQ